MKKLFLCLFVMAAAICFTSCKKEANAGDANKETTTQSKDAKDESAAAEAEPETGKDSMDIDLKESDTSDIKDAKAEVSTAKSGGVLSSIIAKAKAEGDSWNEAQWKEVFKDAMRAMKPMLLEMDAVQKKIDATKDEAEQLRLAAELMKKMEKYESLQKEIEEFGKVLDSNPIAKKLNEDEAFEEEVKKELGLDGIEGL